MFSILGVWVHVCKRPTCQAAYMMLFNIVLALCWLVNLFAVINTEEKELWKTCILNYNFNIAPKVKTSAILLVDYN